MGVEQLNNHTAPLVVETMVGIERNQEDNFDTIVARFFWEEEPTETYTITVDPSTSIELDKHCPVRPHLVRIYEPLPETTKSGLSALFGKTILDLISIPKPNMSFASLELTSDNRLAIARLQGKNPSTPPALRRICTVMIKELELRQLDIAV